MSTDYGFGCKTCNEKIIIDNFRSPRTLVELIPRLEMLAAVEAIPIDQYALRVHLDCEYEGFHDSWRFALKHQRLGHDVTAYDEYGRPYNVCIGQVRCECCAHTRECVLDDAHVGPHQSSDDVRRARSVSE